MSGLIEDADGAPYPEIAQGDSEQAAVLRRVLDRHSSAAQGGRMVVSLCEECGRVCPCSTVMDIVGDSDG